MPLTPSDCTGHIRNFLYLHEWTLGAAQARQMLDEESGVVTKARAELALQNRRGPSSQEGTEGVELDTDQSPAALVLLSSDGPNDDEEVAFTADGLHPEYHRLLNLLTDPYLLHIVLPQLESWQMLFVSAD